MKRPGFSGFASARTAAPVHANLPLTHAWTAAMAAASVRTAQDIFAAIQSLPAVQRDALLFAACQNHADVSARVFEARPRAHWHLRAT